MRPIETFSRVSCFCSQGPIGAGRAIEERRLGGKVHVLGPFSPGQGQKMLKKDILSGGLCGILLKRDEFLVTLGNMLVKGDKITKGTRIEGLGVVNPDLLVRATSLRIICCRSTRVLLIN